MGKAAANMEEKKMMNEVEETTENREWLQDGIGSPLLDYVKVGDFYLPAISLEKVEGYRGKWSRMRMRYLEEEKPAVLSGMLLMDEFNQHMVDIQRQAEERMEELEKQLLKNDPAPDKEKDQMGWVRHMNMIVHQAEEIVKEELIFV